MLNCSSPDSGESSKNVIVPAKKSKRKKKKMGEGSRGNKANLICSYEDGVVRVVTGKTRNVRKQGAILKTTHTDLASLTAMKEQLTKGCNIQLEPLQAPGYPESSLGEPSHIQEYIVEPSVLPESLTGPPVIQQSNKSSSEELLETSEEESPAYSPYHPSPKTKAASKYFVSDDNDSRSSKDDVNTPNKPCNPNVNDQMNLLRARRSLFSTGHSKKRATSTSTSYSFPQCSTSFSQKTPYSLNTPPIAATFSINTINGLTTAIIEMKLHQGNYNVNLIECDEKLMAFLQGSFPNQDHICSMANTEEADDLTYIILQRKLNDNILKVRVEFCSFFSQMQGNEVKLKDDLMVIPLRPIKISKDSNVSSNITKKRHCCTYCQKMLIDMSYHLTTQHNRENAVLELLKMPAKSTERVAALRRLRLEGDDKYNLTVAPRHRILIKRLKKSDPIQNIRCPHCGAVEGHKNFARHEKKCSNRKATKVQVAKKARLIEEEARSATGVVTDPSNNKLFSKNLKKSLTNRLLYNMRRDLIYHEVMSDFVLQKLAVRCAFIHGDQPTALRNDRQTLRRLARILLEIREVDPSVIDYSDCILHCNYDSLLEAVYRLCDSNDEGKLGKSSLACVLRSSITTLIDCLMTSYLESGKNKDHEDYKNAERFKSVHEKNYGTYVGRRAGRNRLEMKAKKSAEMPSPKDVKLFSEFIEKEATTAHADLVQNGFSYDAWLRLGKAEVAQTIVFNRRRVSEVARMTIELYRQRSKLNEAQRSSLPVLEKALADSISVMVIIGKRRHILNVLLKDEQCKRLDLFLSYRKEAGVPDNNSYLFGVPTEAMYIDGSNALRFFSIECKAERPELLRSTYLRKQVATLSQLLSLNDNEISQVARFMGHTKEVHNNFYRQDEKLFQITSWCKFLHLVDDEDINKYRGKTLDEITTLMKDVTLPDDDPSTEDHLEISELVDSATADVVEPLVCTPKKNNTRRAMSYKTPSPMSKTKFLKVSPKKQTIAEVLHKLRSPNKKISMKRVGFSNEEVKLMTTNFVKYISDGSLAPIQECIVLVRENPLVFVNRTGRDVYNWVQYRRNKSRERKLLCRE